MKILKEFKEFAMKGNVLDLAVGVVIGGAFQSIITSLVNDIIMPLTGAFTGNVDYSEWVIKLMGGKVELGIGSFLNAVISFLIIAFSIFMALKCINSLNRKLDGINKGTITKIKKKVKKGEEEKEEEIIIEPTIKTCPYCLSEIPYKATKCAHCASELENNVEVK